MKIRPINNIRLSCLSTAIVMALALSACNSDDDTKEITPTPTPTPPPVVEEIPGDELILDTVHQHIDTAEPISFYVDVTEAAPTLVVSLFSGEANENLGDPDVYVRYEAVASAGEASEFDCVSYNGTDYNETCIIDDAQPGRYHILIDAYAEAATVDASIVATTSLFNQSVMCDVPVQIRAQSMTQEQVQAACDVLVETKARFDGAFADISPAFDQPVENDLNEVTNLNIFSSLSNHAAWAEHLFDTSNTSGIYFETSPTDWWHDSTILTFNAIEWSGGRDVIRSLDHEYIHALDGRYNKEGGYKSNMSWWSEGLAEYLGTFYQRNYQSLVTASEAQPYTLAQIFNGESDAYSWGELAVAYLFEQKPALVTSMLTEMRAGNWDAFDALMADIATNEQARFENWYQQTLPEQFANSAMPLAMNDYQHINGRGGWLYKTTVPENTDSVTFASSGGSGNVDLWVNLGTAAHPYLVSDVSCASTNDGNQETCTLESPMAGDYYMTIGSDFVGGDIIDLYVSACTGVDCAVELPAPMELTTVTEPYLPHWPEKGQLGTCSLAETYRTSYDVAQDVAITNTTETPVKVYWLSTSQGNRAGGSYMTLEQGDSFAPDNWRIGERVMLTDIVDNCLAVAILNDETNDFSIKASHVEGAQSEVVLPEATAEMGSCDLVEPYSRESGNAPEFIVANASSNSYNLYWISDSTGEPYLENVYATLEQNQMYSADFWAIGDRMMVADSDNQCVGVLSLNDTSNIFVLD
ncbi:collagenase [Shewanella waksmanii]|uniref:collagenase n=1 Tax=Shewanella waksmanii TaxID=213783 RepID=UPI0037369DE0